MTDEPSSLVEKYLAANAPKFPIAIEKGFKSFTALGFTGFPSAVLIDPSGKIVWTGHPAELEAGRISTALKNARPPTVFSGPLKSLRKWTDKEDFGQAYSQIKSLLEAGKLDEEHKKIAEGLVSSYEKTAQQLFDDAQQDEAGGDFYGAYTKLTMLTKNYAGIHKTEEALAKLKEFAANKEAKRGIDAGAEYEKVLDAEKQLDYRKALQLCKSIAKKYPGTVAGKMAEEEADRIKRVKLDRFDKKCRHCLKQGDRPCDKHAK